MCGAAALNAPGLSGCAAAGARGAAGFNAAGQELLAALLEHLLPSSAEAPGAGSIGADRYLLGMLSDSRLDRIESGYLRAGFDRFQELVRLSGLAFAEQTSEQREQLLRKLEAEPGGRDWLAAVLGYVLEALLADPVYGGNPGGLGWRWAGHQPGFPRPTPDKRYFLL